jgi:son of sevenless-like protein
MSSEKVFTPVQENKPASKFTETGDIPFGAISGAISKDVEKDKAQGKVMEPEGQVINIGRPPDGTPWHLHPQYADQLDIDDKGNVRSGSLLSLFEMLTFPPKATQLAQYKTFSKVFLMTFRTFMSADLFFNMLVERFHFKPHELLTDSEYLDWKANLLIPVQSLVLEILSRWLEDYQLLEEEPHIAQRLRDFLTQISSYNTSAAAIIHTIDRMKSTKPNCVTSSLSPKKPRKFRNNKLDLLKLDPKIIADQLTVYEFCLYSKITPQQCLSYVKTRTGNDVAKLRDFCSTHDKLGAWVKMSILNGQAAGKRAHTVDFWIKVAEKCRALNNISSMSAIITALSSTVITGLQLTWAHTSRKPALDGLLRHSDPTGGFAGYRALLQQAEGPCVPFITMFLTEMAHVDQISGTEERISFYQRARWFDTITAMLMFQSPSYNIAADESIINLFEGHLREGSCCDPGWFWKKSMETQRAEVTHADIRRGLEAAGF